MNQVTVKFISNTQRVVNGTVWYPGEVWKIDPRLIHAEGIQDLVEVYGEKGPAETRRMDRNDAEKAASTPEAPEVVVSHRFVTDKALKPAQSQMPAKVKKV